MSPVKDDSHFVDVITPGVYTIFNQQSGTVLDFSGSVITPDRKIAGNTDKDPANAGIKPADNQKWQIASLGGGKWLIINRFTGRYVSAPADGDDARATEGYPDDLKAHWKIVAADAANPKVFEFQSVAHGGDVFELNKGSETDNTPMKAYAQNKTHWTEVASQASSFRFSLTTGEAMESELCACMSCRCCVSAVEYAGRGIGS